MIFTEEDFRVIVHLQVIAPDTAQILGNHRTDPACLNVSGQLLPCGTLKIAAAPAIIGVVDAICKASSLRIGLKILFLVDDAVAVANQFVVPGETFI